MGVGGMSYVIWLFEWYNKANGPVEYDEVYIIDTILHHSIFSLALVCFVVTLVFNIHILKKTPRTVFNIIGEILISVLIALLSALLFSNIYYLYL